MNHRARIERLESVMLEDPVIITWENGTRQRTTPEKFLQFIQDAENGSTGPLIESAEGVHPLLAELYNIITQKNREGNRNAENENR